MTVSVDIHNSGIASTYNLTAHLQAADIATLNSVPITLVATPGPNTAIVVVSTSLEYKPGTGTWAAPYGGVAWGSLPTDNTLAQAVKIATTYPGLLNIGLPEETTGVSAPAHSCISQSFGEGLNAPDVTVANNQALLFGVWQNAQTGSSTYGFGDPIRKNTITTSTKAAGGSGYAIGDTGDILINRNTADPTNYGNYPALQHSTFATYVVDTVDGGGAVLTYHIVNHDPVYFVTTSAVPTLKGGAQAGVGTGFRLNITAIDGSADGDLYIAMRYATVAINF